MLIDLYFNFPLHFTFLQVGQKKGGADDGDDLAEDEAADATAGANAANPKAAFARAKSKVLQKLSTQHLVSHTLPVVISLKHTLEASKSALQVCFVINALCCGLCPGLVARVRAIGIFTGILQLLALILSI